MNDISRLLLFTPPNHPPTTATTHTLFVERRLIITPSNPSGDDGEPFAATNKIIYNNYNAAGNEEPIDYIGRYHSNAGTTTDERHSDDCRPETLLSVSN
jgi:hypothetical protein